MHRPTLALILALAGGLVLAGCECDASPDTPDGSRPDAGDDAGPDPRCAEGEDTDFDGLDDATECALGYDPTNPDMDGDGVRDGVEHNYPRACVASDPAMQRREPLPACMTDADCGAGEACVGLDPNNPDSDGDGVGDGLEDTNFDGMIDPGRGETDPRLTDTDGDGEPDGMEGIAVCRPDGLAMPDLVGVPMAMVQLALDNEWGAPRGAPMAGGAGLTFDDATAEVAALAYERPAAGADVVAEATAVEAALSSGAGGAVTGVLVGRSVTTHDGHAAITSFYRVVPSPMGSAAAARDGAAASLMGGAPEPSTESWRDVAELYLEVTTVLNAMTMRTSVVAAFAPSDAFDDATRQTAIRVRDLTNATGLAESGRTLGFNCELFDTTRDPRADFLWLVDTSGSMNGDQENLGRVAGDFFDSLTLAGVDFRVGVFDAYSRNPVDLDTPGFAFINGTDPMGAQQLQFEVTRAAYMGMAADTFTPYPSPRSGEEPVATGVTVVEAFEAQAAAGSTDPDRTLRPETQVVAMFVTDEPGTNDDGRYFSTDAGRWGATPEARIAGATQFYTDRDILAFGLINDYGEMCPAQRDFPKCTVLGTGGAFIPITTATPDEVRIAMDRIVEAVAGAASSYVFATTPISATIRVMLNGVEVPRSRADGFDYDGASNSIVFRGATHRPTIGSEVVVSYRIWGRGVM